MSLFFCRFSLTNLVALADTNVMDSSQLPTRPDLILDHIAKLIAALSKPVTQPHHLVVQQATLRLLPRTRVPYLTYVIYKFTRDQLNEGLTPPEWDALLKALIQFLDSLPCPDLDLKP